MASISLPRRMLVGPGTTQRVGQVIKELGLANPLIVTDPFHASSASSSSSSSSSSSALTTITASLQANGIHKYRIFSETIPDPTTKSVDHCRNAMHGHDSVIALGGGSPMDTAKAAAVLNVFGGKMRDYKAPFMMDKPSLPIVAIPTTAGTGSEVTKFTIVTDSDTEEKMLCVGLAYLPVAAIVDYELTLSMPLRLTADTGIDAFCHAMEAYVSAKRNPFSDTQALSALAKISRNIREACFKPDSREAREAMMLAATEAGMAFSNASVTLIHGCSRPIGALFHVPHGMSNAMLAPQITKFSLGGAVKRYADVARACGLVEIGLSDEDAAECLPKALYLLNQELKVPTMKEFGISEAQFFSLIPKMAKDALASGSPNNNPIIPTQNEIETLYRNIYLGKF